MRSWLKIFLPGFKLFFNLSYSLLSILKSVKHRVVCTKICQSWKISILFAIGFTDCLKMTASLQWVSQKWPHFENPTVNTTTNRKCHSSFVTFDLWLRCMNLANEIPFFWHVALTTGYSLDFKWDLDFGSFFLALSFLFFTYLVHCL